MERNRVGAEFEEVFKTGNSFEKQARI